MGVYMRPSSIWGQREVWSSRKRLRRDNCVLYPARRVDAGVIKKRGAGKTACDHACGRVPYSYCFALGYLDPLIFAKKRKEKSSVTASNSQNPSTSPTTPSMAPVHQPTSFLLLLAAIAVLEVVLSLLVTTPGRATSVMLASKPVFGRVTVVGTALTVAVTATPLELMVTRVLPAAFVVMATNVWSELGPMVVETPGVSAITAEPSVIELGMAPGVVPVALGMPGPGVMLFPSVCGTASTAELPVESTVESSPESPVVRDKDGAGCASSPVGCASGRGGCTSD